MQPLRRSNLLACAFVASLGAALHAQANLIPGVDVSLSKMDQIRAMGRQGSFPNGLNGVAMATTCCNKGTVKVTWDAAMLEDHPLIAFIVVRESGGRLTQVNDYSYVKHGFFALTDSYCDNCQEGPFGGGDVLGIGCSDTYSTSNNGDQFWLGPPGEIDPWLGEWEASCSHFDKGEPAVSPPQDCDGNRSLSTTMASALNPVGHRMNITDQEFLAAGNWYYQGYYVIRGEAEDSRENNWGTRKFTPNWTGSQWSLPSTPGFTNGSVLNRWAGASVTSIKNGNNDGRVYAAVRVTGPVEGRYHYEYAFQNRDNMRGIGDVSIPICSGAIVENFGFSDVDDESGNDWTATIGATSIDISAGSNPLRWNTIYNVWFDSDAAPATGSASLDQYDTGAGLDSLSISTQTPQALYNVFLGDGCSSSGDAPSLYANGQATLGNTGFQLGSAGNVGGSAHVVLMSANDGTVNLGGGCTQYFLGTVGAGAYLVGAVTTDTGGVATHAAPIPNMPALEGLHINVQGAGINSTGGPLAGFWELTDGLRVRLGNTTTGCP